VPVEGDAALTDRDLGEGRAYLAVEPVAVHAEVSRCVPETDETRGDHLCIRREGFGRGTAIADVWSFGTSVNETSAGEAQSTGAKHAIGRSSAAAR
jgi:hypothetical protein